MAHSTFEIVNALLDLSMSDEKIPGLDAIPMGCTVTLSRDYGSTGFETAKQLAKKLGVRCFDKEILDAIAEQSNVDIGLLEKLDEHSRGFIEQWATSLISGKAAYHSDYKRHLVNIVLGIARQGGVIVGRGAHLILDPRRVFRVRITGSLEECAERIAARESISVEQATKKVKQVNDDRAAYVKRMFHVPLHDASRFDVILNSDRHSPEDLADIIVHAMRKAKLPVPD